ncbi:hypothetical protein [Streptomyces sp. NPDC058086]|uniref:hypothetical protein n=1 Tax=Streptomyces sp. NPDC058086 TaxID=3346334 RepID=UPI0036ED9993
MLKIYISLAPEGFDDATLYAYTLLRLSVAVRVRAVFLIRAVHLVLRSPAGLAAEVSVCAMLLQAVSRGDNLTLAETLRDWSKGMRRR